MEQILRRELKSWQKAFKAKHNRDPTKRDILADPAIAGAYDTWQAVGGDAKAKSKPRATSSKQKLDEDVVRTPVKKKRSEKFSEATVPVGSPSRNPFRTPTKSPRRNPFATPSKGAVPAEISPARSMVEVEVTPTKSSPLLALSKCNFAEEQYVTSSPSKIRNAVAAASRLTPTKSPSRTGDAALKQALVAYTPRTKARKRLRGEDVPPTPHRLRGAVASRTDPRPAQRGLGAFGFASQRKPEMLGVGRSVTAPASVFLRTKTGAGSGEEEDKEMLGESPIKAVAKLRRSASSKPGFRPLFASPKGNRVPQDVGEPYFIGSRKEAKGDEDALMDDKTAPVGGLFAAEVQQQRLRRSRESESASPDNEKRHKSRPAPQMPSSSSDDEGHADAYTSSSPAYRTSKVGIVSSPNTEVTVPSSASRASKIRAGEASSPVKEAVGWRKVQEVELSDEEGGKKFSIAPYQLYGTSRAPTNTAEEEEEEEEEDFTSYALVNRSQPARAYAVDRTNSDSESDDDPHASLAGLKLSPVRHAPSTKSHLASRKRLLSSIFDPTARRDSHTTGLYNEARFGSLQPSISPSTSDEVDDEDAELKAESTGKTRTIAPDSDDDDDWQQEVDEDFTFLDTEIELQDVA